MSAITNWYLCGLACSVDTMVGAVSPTTSCLYRQVSDMILFLGTINLLTGFPMVGCRHLKSLGNPQEFYFVGVLRYTPLPPREIPNPSALVQTYSLTSPYRSRFLALPRSFWCSIPLLAHALLLTRVTSCVLAALPTPFMLPASPSLWTAESTSLATCRLPLGCGLAGLLV